MTKEPEECFGFVIHSSLRAEDTFKVGQVVADSPAGRCPDLLEGDSVLTVNGKRETPPFLRDYLGLEYHYSLRRNLSLQSISRGRRI